MLSFYDNEFFYKWLPPDVKRYEEFLKGAEPERMELRLEVLSEHMRIPPDLLLPVLAETVYLLPHFKPELYERFITYPDQTHWHRNPTLIMLARTHKEMEEAGITSLRTPDPPPPILFPDDPAAPPAGG